MERGSAAVRRPAQPAGGILRRKPHHLRPADRDGRQRFPAPRLERAAENPYGEAISYGELARRIGIPSASRAVGTANRLNPIAVIVPCHRVIGADGSLTGYGGGLERKRFLLDLEAGVLELASQPLPA